MEDRIAQEDSRATSGSPIQAYYLIFSVEGRGLEMPHVLLDSGEGVLPAFSSSEAAHRFLSSRTLDDTWRVRLFSAGELISLLLAFYSKIEHVMVNPLPPLLLSGDEMSPLMSRDGFIDFLMGIGK